MIEPMKKVAVVCLESDRLRTLEHLRELGVIHIVPVREPQSPDLEALLRRRDAADRARNLLKLTAQEVDPKDAPLPETHRNLPPERLAAEVLRIQAEIQAAEARETELKRDLALLDPWGSFDPESLERIRRSGLQVLLGTAPEKALPPLPEGAALQVLFRKNKRVWFVVIAPEQITIDGIERPPLPEITDRNRLQREIQEQRETQQRLRQILAGLHRAKGNELQQEILRLDEVVEFARARESMGSGEQLAWITGYVPVSAVPPLRRAAREHGWALRLTDPSEDDADVPTRIVLPRWVEPIRVVFHALGILPGYREVDISMWFLLFLSLFFAMLIGDAGYGVLFLAAAVAARKRFPDAPAPPFYLFMIFAVTTIVWGALTGVWFGIAHLPAPLARLEVPWLKDPANIQRLCFLLGAIQLTIGHSWNAILYAPSRKALGQLGWASFLWGNYFLARKLVVGDSVPLALMLGLYAAGLLGIILFSNPSRSLLKTLGAGLGDFLLGFVGSFVDVVSYIRLYAVGAASLAIEQTFNQMAAQMHLLPWLTPLLAALILAAGHGLNILLGGMAVVVHGIRLNVLEFSSHLGLQWAGAPYRPFARRAPAANSAASQNSL